MKADSGGAYLSPMKSHPGESYLGLLRAYPSSLFLQSPIMSFARDIRPRQDEVSAFATSPSASFQSSYGSAPTRTIPIVNAKHLKPFATEDIKVLLLENVNQTGREILSQQGYQVEFLKSSLPEDQLIEKIRWVSLYVMTFSSCD